MYFQAESDGVKYEISVSETRKTWRVSFKPEEGEWKRFEVDKADYKYMDQTISFLFNNSSYLMDVTSDGLNFDVYTRGSYQSFKIYNEENLLHESLKAGGGLKGAGNLESGMPGKIVKILCEPGQELKEGDPLLIMEAMKMENEMRATRECKVKEIHVSAGQNVDGGTLLISFES